MTKQRIEWIDTAKGICINIVMLYHSLIHTHADCLSRNTNVEIASCASRMPLYLLTLLLSKKMGKIRIISYVGRYFLIVLCTHFYYENFLSFMYNELHNISILLLCSIFTFLSCYIIIQFFIINSKGSLLCKTAINTNT